MSVNKDPETRSRSPAPYSDAVSDPDPTGAMAEMGQQIRGLRTAHGLTLGALSERCGVSVGFLSKIERGLARPSLTVLQEVATALDVSVGWFFVSDGPVPAEERSFIVRAERRRRLSYSGTVSTDYLGMEDHLLSASLDRTLAMGITTYAPGGSTGDDLYTHEGEEAGMVLEGEIDLCLEDSVFRLRPGDSFSFESTRPHRFANPGPAPARIVWANTPVSLRREGR